MARAKFELKSEDIQKISDSISKFPSDAEDTINSYLHGPGKEKMIKSMENIIPISERKKKHAKGNSPLRSNTFNLGLTIRTKTKYNYLYFPQMAEGTSKKNSPNDFMQKGLDSIYDSVVNDMIDKITNKIQGGL